MVGDLFRGTVAWGFGGGGIVKWGSVFFFLVRWNFFCGELVGGTVLKGDIFFFLGGGYSLGWWFGMG